MFAPPKNGPARKPPPYRGVRMASSHGDLRLLIRSAVEDCVKEMISVKDDSHIVNKDTHNRIQRRPMTSGQVRYQNRAIRQRSLCNSETQTADLKSEPLQTGRAPIQLSVWAVPAASHIQIDTTAGTTVANNNNNNNNGQTARNNTTTEPHHHQQQHQHHCASARNCPSANAHVAEQCETLLAEQQGDKKQSDDPRQWMNWRSTTPFTQKNSDLKDFRHWQNPHKPPALPTPPTLSRPHTSLANRPQSTGLWRSQSLNPMPKAPATAAGPTATTTSTGVGGNYGNDQEQKQFHLSYAEAPDGTSQFHFQTNSSHSARKFNRNYREPPKASTFDSRRVMLYRRPMSADATTTNKPLQQDNLMTHGNSANDLNYMKNWIDKARDTDRQVLQQLMKALEKNRATPTGLEGIRVNVDSHGHSIQPQNYCSPQEFYSRMIRPMTPMQQYFPTHQYNQKPPMDSNNGRPPKCFHRPNILRVKHQEIQTTPRIETQANNSRENWKNGQLSANVIQTCPQRLRNIFT